MDDDIEILWKDYEFKEGWAYKILKIKMLKSGDISKKSNELFEKAVRQGWELIFPLDCLDNLKPGYYGITMYRSVSIGQC